MKLLAGLFLVIASVCASQAQTFIMTAKGGEKIGTVTIDGNRAYLRDLEEKLIGTVVALPDGTRTIYDPDGKIVKKVLPDEDQNPTVRR